MPDNMPNWLLKEYSDILAFPITHILNASYQEQWLPAIWKMANVPPLPKKKPVLDLKKDFRAISLTLCVSKVADEFVVEDVVKPAVLDVIRDFKIQILRTTDYGREVFGTGTRHMFSLHSTVASSRRCVVEGVFVVGASWVRKQKR